MSLSKPAAKRKIEDEKRTFQVRWESMYFFTEVKEKLVCLICHQSVAVPKEYNVRRHYETCHRDAYGALEGKIREEKVQQLKAGQAKQRELFRKASKTCDDAVRASFVLAELIAKSSKPFTEGQFIKECMVKAAEIVCPDKRQAFENISLSANTVVERINELANDLQKQLTRLSCDFEAFSLAVDESTDVTDVAQCAIFVRGVDSQLKVTEELLDLVPMKGTTTGADIMDKLEASVEKAGLKWDKLVCLATDGAPSMVGKRSGVVGRLKQKLDGLGVSTQFTAIHCILHQEALCGKSLKMKHVMDTVVKTVNFLRSNGLNHRQFTSFLESVDSEYGEIIYHSEVRWLSRGNVLKRFFALREEIDSFMKSKGKEVHELSDNIWISDLAFLTDIMEHMNCLNIKLQGKNQVITEMYDSVRAFVIKLRLWESQLKNNNLIHFPTLKSLGCVNAESLKTYTAIISDLLADFDSRFKDFQCLEVDFKLFATPFSVDVDTVKPELQMELVDMQCDTILKEKYHSVGVPAFYTYVDAKHFPQLRSAAIRILAMFGSTYLCEQLFSIMKINKSPMRSRLSDENLQSILRVVTAQEIKPNISALVEAKRCQVSGRRKE